MKGLILKDLYSIKNYLKIYSVTFLFFLVYAVCMKSPTYLVFMGMLMGVSTLFAVLSLDEASGFAFVMSLPVTRKQIMLEKYLFFAGMMALIWGVTTILGIFVNLYAKKDLRECIFSALFCTALYLVMMSLIIPVAIKLGVQKARYVMMACVALPCVVVIGWAQMQETKQTWMAAENALNQSFGIILAGTFVVAGLTYMISYWISQRIFAKKEF